MTSAVPIVVTSRTGAAFQSNIRTAYVYNGARGPEGRPGVPGPTGPQGASINIVGQWNSGLTYGPNDGVTYTSSALQGVTNLYVQRSDFPAGISTVPPSEDAARWIEIGDTGFGSSFGNIWEVTQVGHGLTLLGTPLFWNGALGLYQQAENTPEGSLPVAVIREIPDGNSLVLQSSGLLPLVDAGIIEGGGVWEDGRVYFQRQNGLVSTTPPGTGFAVPVLKAVGAGGIVFPYQNANTIPAPDPAPVPATTQIKVDDISSAFDNVETDFPLTVASAPVALAPAESFDVYIDGHRQQPLVDYVIADSGGNSVLSFSKPPEDFQIFWCVYASG